MERLLIMMPGNSPETQVAVQKRLFDMGCRRAGGATGCRLPSRPEQRHIKIFRSGAFTWSAGREKFGQFKRVTAAEFLEQYGRERAGTSGRRLAGLPAASPREALWIPVEGDEAKTAQVRARLKEVGFLESKGFLWDNVDAVFVNPAGKFLPSRLKGTPRDVKVVPPEVVLRYLPKDWPAIREKTIDGWANLSKYNKQDVAAAKKAQRGHPTFPVQGRLVTDAAVDLDVIQAATDAVCNGRKAPAAVEESGYKEDELDPDAYERAMKLFR